MVLSLKDTADFKIPTKNLIDNDANFNYTTSGSINAYDRTYLDIINASRTKFFPPDKLLIERSTDGGSTWTTLTTSDFNTENRGKMMSDIGASLNIGTGNPTTSQQLRVTLQYPGSGWYCSLDRAYIRFSMSGHTTSVTLQASTYGAQSTYTDIAANQSISGWPGDNMVKFTSKTAWGTNASYHLYNIRFIFKYTAINSSYASNQANVSRISMFGKDFWGTTGTPRYAGHLYNWDYLQNVTFPAALTATTLKTGTAAADHLLTRKIRGDNNGTTYYHAIDMGYSSHDRCDWYEYGGLWHFWKNTSSTATTDTANLALRISLDNLQNKSYTYTWPNKTGTLAVTSDLDAKVDIASVSLEGQTTTLLAQVQALAAADKDYGRFSTDTNGGSSGISDKPTGGTNCGFCCTAYRVRDYGGEDQYYLTCYCYDDANPYTAVVSQNSSSISWSRMKPTVNNATLTIQKNGTTVNTFTANASSDVTANITVPTSFSDLSGTVTDTQIDWSTLCAPDAETETTTMAETYTKFYRVQVYVRSIFGGHGFEMGGMLDFGGTNGAATINKTAVTGLTGYYGFKTSATIPTAPNTTMLYKWSGIANQWVPGSSNGGDRWYGNDPTGFAVDTTGAVWLGVDTKNTQSITAWQRIQYRYATAAHMIDH